MIRTLRTLAVGTLMAVAVLAPSTMAHAAPGASTSATHTVEAAAATYVPCGTSRDDCVQIRSNYARYHRVSDIYQQPNGTYYFYYFS